MKTPESSLVVLDIAGAQARLQTDSSEFEVMLAAYGFVRSGDQLVRPIADDIDRQDLVRKFIEMDALFAAGKDWSPAELVDYYRENGIILKSYRMIFWSTPDTYAIVTR
jgi:hypothetical protein